MKLGIDASNTRAGGTATHLIELLRAACPPDFGFDQVIIWAGSAFLGRIEERGWLTKVAEPLLEQAANPYLDRRHLQRAWWQRFRLRQLAQAAGCDLLFAPGGVHNSGFRPTVTMSRNMLVFDPHEARRYGWSPARLRLWILRRLQGHSFRTADGMIFLTEYAREVISRATGLAAAKSTVIAHGVNQKFSLPPRPQQPISAYSHDRPYRVLYVSTVDTYKHQWNVAEAIARLRAAGLPVILDLVGPAYRAGMQKLTEKLAVLEGSADFVRYRGEVPYDVLHDFYANADLKVFASSCENLPNILLQAMAAGLPIACSRCRPMPDVLGEAGVYFDPEDPADLTRAIETLIRSPELRARNAAMGYECARQYSWKRCAAETFTFLAERAREYHAGSLAKASEMDR